MRSGQSQTRKAIQSRELRNRRGNERLFNIPLQKFIEHKYPAIHNEYVELYNIMRTLHPNRRKLETSSTFREWKVANPPVETQGQHTVTSLPLVIPQCPCGDLINQALQGAFTEETPTQNNEQNPSLDTNMLLQEAIGEETRRQNNVQKPIQDIEHLPPPAEQDPNENNGNFNEVDDIVNEMMANEDIRNTLDQPDPNADEGIELNILDEIEFDIEPFDFDVEVDLYDY